MHGTGAWALAAALVTALCYALPVRRDDYGDILAHAAFAEQMAAVGRPLQPHFLFHLVTVAVSALLGVSVQRAAMLAVLGSRAATAALLTWVLVWAPWSRRPWTPPAAAVAATALLLVGPVSVFSFPTMYQGYIGVNVAHNPTVVLLAPLALVQFVVTFRAMTGLARGPLLGVSLTTAGLGLVSGLAKPSFDLSFAPAVGLAALTGHAGTSPHARRRSLLVAGSLAIAVSALLVWQFLMSFPEASDASGRGAGVALAPLAVAARWNQGSLPQLLIRVVLSMAFPLAVLVAYGRWAPGRDALRMAWLNAAIALGLFLLLAETGHRRTHGNFVWGAQTGLWLLMIVSLDVLHAAECDGRTARPSSALSLRARACLAVLATHLVSGLLFLQPLSN